MNIKEIITENSISFEPIESKWKRWDEILNESINPGIYVIALSDNKLSISNQSIICNDVVYIGMTNSKFGLKQRLNQFNNVIIGKSGHGGADRFMFDHDVNIVKNMYYKTLEFSLDNIDPGSKMYYLIHGEVAKFEYIMFAQYITFQGELPKYNKRTSPKKSKVKKN